MRILVAVIILFQSVLSQEVFTSDNITTITNTTEKSNNTQIKTTTIGSNTTEGRNTTEEKTRTISVKPSPTVNSFHVAYHCESNECQTLGEIFIVIPTVLTVSAKFMRRTAEVQGCNFYKKSCYNCNLTQKNFLV